MDGQLSILERLKADGSIGLEGAPAVHFCDSGVLSSISWFYASEVAGVENVKLYPESVIGWARDPANPLVKGGGAGDS